MAKVFSGGVLCALLSAFGQTAQGPVAAPENAAVLNELGQACEKRGDHTNAVRYLERALAIRDKSAAPEDANTAAVLSNLGMACSNLHDYRKAERVLLRAAPLCEKTLRPNDPRTGGVCEALANVYWQVARFDQARPWAERTLAIYDTALGPTHPRTLAVLKRLAALEEMAGEDTRAAELRHRAGDSPMSPLEKVFHAWNQARRCVKQRDYARAEPLFEQALALCCQELQTNQLFTVPCLSEFAAAYDEWGKFAKAEPLYQENVALSEQALGRNHPRVATALANLATHYKITGQFAKAEPLYQRALEIYEKALGPKAADTATCLYSLGTLYNAMGQYDQAEALLQRSLGLSQRLWGTNALPTASALNDLGVVYLHKGNYRQAEPLFQQALHIRETQLGPDHPDTATSLTTLGNLYVETGAYTKGEALLQRGLQIREHTFGPDHPTTAVSLQALGVLYLQTGEHAKAEAALKRALQLKQKAFGSDSPDAARALANLAALYNELGDVATAGSLYEQAFKIREHTLGPEHPETVGNLNLLGQMAVRAGDYLKAESLLQRALELCQKTLGSEHPDTATAMNDVASVYEQLADYDRAEALLQRVLALREKALGPEHPDTAQALNNLAADYHLRGQAARAEPLQRRAVGIYEQVFGPEHPKTQYALRNLGFLLLDLGKSDEATALADRAVRARLHELTNVLSFASERSRLEFQATTPRMAYSLSASLSNAPQMALALLRSKGVVLDSLLEDRRLAEAAATPEARRWLDDLAAAKAQLTQLLLQPSTSAVPGADTARARRGEELADQVEQLEGKLARHVTGLGRARQALTVTPEQVQAALPPHGALLEFIRYRHYLGQLKWENRYGVLVLLPAGAPRWMCLGQAEPLEQELLACQQCVRARAGESKLQGALRALYRRLWEPLAPLLPPDTRTLILGPDAGLNLLPFAALLTPDDQFLAQKYSLRYVTTGRDLVRRPEPSAALDMVVFAAPQYAPGDVPAQPDSVVRLVPLPGFATNALALAAAAKQWHWPVRVYTGAEATEAQLRAVQSPRILHLSTHGFFLPETLRKASFLPRANLRLGSTDASEPEVVLSNPMHRSALALAGAQATLDAWSRGEVPPTDTDGLLTAEEAASLHLEKTWLVTLAACDTGVGQLLQGEGVLGLRRGFIQAGTQNLLLTLWPVAVDATGRFLLDFYRAAHQSGDAPQALADTQREWLLKVRKQEGLLPAVVLAAPFILSSQGAPGPVAR